ncbi:MAG: ATP-dependent 6-phosphofructokinase [Candidatus Electryonea clarkiae]|nr:ATP-dependent 6-phosphofructokinase [Candidatus Electryonea clarkiae]MDP8286516.1 ATP-dependent 6-phosphofructokinase [Candidatus Electryonea clarkiae]
MRIGITTGGGDAPGLNAVIRAVVKTARRKYHWDVIGIEDGFHGLIDTRHIVKLDEAFVRGILPKGGTILGTTNRGNPFEYDYKNLDGTTTTLDVSDKCMENFESLGLDALIAIGGDGTMAITQKFFEKGMPVVGVPKTIDNDLMVTDVTFGFNTAVTTATDAIDKLHTTAEAHHRTMVLEVMGRDAGWIALEAGVSGGADLILIPEIPYDLDAALKYIRTRYARGSTFCIAVLAEAAVPAPHPTETYEKRRDTDSPAPWFAGMVRKHLNVDVRTTILGHLQRGGGPTCFDRMLGTRFGVHAAELVKEEKFGRMVTLQGRSINDVLITEAAGKQKLVNPEGELIHTAEALGIFCGRKLLD